RDPKAFMERRKPLKRAHEIMKTYEIVMKAVALDEKYENRRQRSKEKKKATQRWKEKHYLEPYRSNKKSEPAL
ncbi:unnamed protein product, partial [marine sediment metagenome]